MNNFLEKLKVDLNKYGDLPAVLQKMEQNGTLQELNSYLMKLFHNEYNYVK